MMNKINYWRKAFDISEAMVVLRHDRTYSNPRVTIGLPTYKRASTIHRALRSISRQTYRNFVLIISDNGGRDPETLRAVEEVISDLPSVILVAQEQNYGAVRNLSYLLAVAKTEYFMWLADDDEITPNYLEQLVFLLDSNLTAVSAMGYWKSMKDCDLGVRRCQSRHDQKRALFRAVRYVYGPTDDSLFYGLHRTKNLRGCNFEGYFFPNIGVLTNFCYVFMFGQILQGEVAYSDCAGWISHNYGEKHYKKAGASGARERLRTLIRRVNVHILYVRKTYEVTPKFMLPVVCFSVLSIVKEVMSFITRKVFARGRTKSAGDGVMW